MRRPTRIGAAFVAAVVFAACATSARDDRAPAAAAGGGTLQVAMTEPAYHGFDPQASYSQPQFELLRCCLVRTLMTYRGVPNFEGTQPVPDLATGPPSVSTDGKTWTFHLRPGIHYAPPLQDVTVTSGDIVRALLRAGSGQVNGGPGIAVPWARSRGSTNTWMAVQRRSPESRRPTISRCRYTRSDPTARSSTCSPWRSPPPSLPFRTIPMRRWAWRPVTPSPARSKAAPRKRRGTAPSWSRPAPT